MNFWETLGRIRNCNESGIRMFGLTVTPLAIFGDRSKRRPKKQVVNPDGDSATAEHS
jgi:hypothetical protein